MNTPGNQPDSQAALGLGVIVLCIIFLVVGCKIGEGDNENSPPNEAGATETVEVAVTDIKTVTATPSPVPYLPEACATVIDAAQRIQDGTRLLSGTLAELSRVIDGAGKVVYTDDPNEVVHLVDQWKDLQYDQTEAWRLIGTANADMTRELPDCPR